jgi:hypothetical protein
MTAFRVSRRPSFLVAASLAVAGVIAAACSGSKSNPIETTGVGGLPPSLDGGPIGPPTTDAAGDAVASDAPSEATEDAGGPSPPPPDAGPPLCSPMRTLGAGTLVARTSDPDLLGAVTPDELVIAWTSLSSDGGVSAIHWKERGATGAPFGSLQTLDSSFGPFAPDHVGLSGDGLRLVVVSADRTQVTEISRTARGQDFDTNTTASDFANADPSDGMPLLGPFASPTFSPDFSLWAFDQVGVNGFVVAANIAQPTQSAAWFVPRLPSGLIPPASGPSTIVATGWSSDDRTLFYWDTDAGVERMAFMDPYTSKTALFAQQTVSLGSTAQYAFPSGDCSSVYYSAPGASGDLDIFVAPML